MNIPKLIERVKASRLLSEEDRKYWLNKMETMNEKDLVDLDSLLENGEKIDWEKELPKYEVAVREAGKVYAKAESTLQAVY